MAIGRCFNVAVIVLGLLTFTCVAEKIDFTELSSSLKGDLYEKSESNSMYQSAIDMWNTRFDRYPMAVAMVENIEDVQHCVHFAKSHNLNISVKSTGHDFLGRSNADNSLMINLKRIDRIQINAAESDRSKYGEIQVGTGNTWARIYKELNNSNVNRVVVGGSSPTVSPGGYTQGGGHSPLSNMYGLAVDNVLEMEAVLADGRRVIITEDKVLAKNETGEEERISDGDLFWALRGGGGGTFAIVLYYTYKLHEDNEVTRMGTSIAMSFLFEGNIYYEKEKMNELHRIVEALPDSYSGYLSLANLPIEVQGSTVIGYITVSLLKFGPWDNSTDDAIWSSIEQLEPNSSLIAKESYRNFYDYQSGVPEEGGGDLYTVNTLTSSSSFNESLTDFTLNWFLIKNDHNLFIAGTHTILGGTVHRASLESTPLHWGWRQARTSFSCVVGMDDNNRYIAQSYGKDFGRELRKLGNGEYLNEPDYLNANYRDDYWGNGNYEKLKRIKEKFDPHVFFNCYHCVGNTIGDGMMTAGSPILTPTLLLIQTLFLVAIFW